MLSNEEPKVSRRHHMTSVWLHFQSETAKLLGAFVGSMSPLEPFANWANQSRCEMVITYHRIKNSFDGAEHKFQVSKLFSRLWSQARSGRTHNRRQGRDINRCVLLDFQSWWLAFTIIRLTAVGARSTLHHILRNGSVFRRCPSFLLPSYPLSDQVHPKICEFTVALVSHISRKLDNEVSK